MQQPGFDPLFDQAFEDQKAQSAFIHESSYVDSPCRIGENTSILHFSHVMAHSIIGDNCYIDHNVTVASGVLIANHVQVMNNVTLNTGLIMENDVYCGPSTVFTENRFMRSNRDRYGEGDADNRERRGLRLSPMTRISPTVVRRGAKIGANTTVGSGFTIGKFSFIEAGSVVDSHVPDFAIVYGNPIQFGGWQCRCGQSLPLSLKKEEQQAQCPHCGSRYAQIAKYKLVLMPDGVLSESTEKGTSHLDSYSEFNAPIRKTQI